MELLKYKKEEEKYKKAFTLIELLAVIIIIAVVALITIPIMIGIIAKTQKEAFKEAVRGVYKAAEMHESEKLLDKKDPYCSVYNFSENKESDYLSEEELDQIFGKDVYDKNQKYKYELIEKLSFTGTKPTEGIIANCNGKKLGKLGNGKYIAVPDGEDILVSAKDGVSDADKENGSISLVETSGSLTYPEEKTITITKNTDGKLNCSSSNTDIATCNITDTTLTIHSGTTAGTAEITVTSEETKNYTAASATYSITVASGTLSVTANGYSGTYDGKAHGITVTSNGATIKYGTQPNVYDLTDSPTYTNTGNHFVYYEITRPGYETVIGYKIVDINFNENCWSPSETNISLKYPETKVISYGDIIDGSYFVTAYDENIATWSRGTTPRTIEIKSGTTAGTTTIRLNFAATQNCGAVSATYNVTVTK